MTICLLLALLGAQLPVPTWSVSGRVTERETGQPLPRARVSIYSGSVVDLSARTPERSTVTDVNGGYEFPGMPIGSYTILAQPPPHVLTHLPQRFGLDTFDWAAKGYFISGSSDVVVKSGDVRDRNIALARAVTVEGRVLSDQGDPLAGISVSLSPLDRGALDPPPARFTDDRGAFRLFGAAPGRYRVCASAPARTTLQPSAPFRRSCYPGDTGVLDLTSSTAEAIEIRLARAKAAIVSGRAYDADGAPLDRGEIQLFEREIAVRRPLPLERTAGGGFVVRNVDPGSYEIAATLMPDHPLDSRGREIASVLLTVDKTDIENVIVRTRRAARVSGVVVFDEGVPEKGTSSMQVSLRVDPSPSLSGPYALSPTARVKEDLTFDLGGLLDPGRIGVTGQPQGWVVRSVLYQGRDITNVSTTFETTTDPHAIEIRLTNRVAHLSGTVTTAVPGPVAVLLIAADRNQWTSPSVIVAVGARKPDGAFALGPVAPGDYLVLAIGQGTMVEILRNPKSSLERVAAGATRIFLGENDRQTITLHALDK